ncbi:DUF3105 domain-containing protein [Nocardioides caldifontis]|uniref:DUF3105 domain-containing protein n=1 Tax=Nocardioides caldifontis TaxID=2588938 RepID=UPI0011DFDC19|nr:DUF3105 domain-containing protein [Nocardioides caldifontis]
MAKRPEAQDRRARAAALQAEHRRDERRRTVLIVGACAAVAVVIIGMAVIALLNQQRERDEIDAAASESIEGVEQFTDLSRNHVETAVDYPQTPSVGGDHSSVWVNCGTYTSAIDPMQATHSLEHGAVWIGYDPSLEAAEVEKLVGIAEANNYVLLSPVEDVPAPVTVSAWGNQLQLESPDDPRLEVFVQKYQQGEQTPEPGAPCTGGSGGM